MTQILHYFKKSHLSDIFNLLGELEKFEFGPLPRENLKIFNSNHFISHRSVSDSSEWSRVFNHLFQAFQTLFKRFNILNIFWIIV